jgi:hypothetical protein
MTLMARDQMTHAQPFATDAPGRKVRMRRRREGRISVSFVLESANLPQRQCWRSFDCCGDSEHSFARRVKGISSD